MAEGNQLSTVSQGGLRTYHFLLSAKKPQTDWLLNTHLKDFRVKSALLSENVVLNTY